VLRERKDKSVATIGYLPAGDDFPPDLSALSDDDLQQLASYMREEFLRDCASPLRLLREITLMRSALVDLELAFRRG
jgi:hypothetical protein